jgi:hypothetical protein
MHVALERNWKVFSQFIHRGVKIKMITEVTLENITYYKYLLEYYTIMTKNIRGNFG